jgi:hypothetical protein
MQYEITLNVLNEEDKREKIVYLVDAVSIESAISKALAFASPYYSDTDCIAAKQVKCAGIIVDESADDRFYRAKMCSITIDERTAKEKRQPIIYVFQADDLNDAKNRIDKEIRQWLVDTEVVSISETKIVAYIS